MKRRGSDAISPALWTEDQLLLSQGGWEGERLRGREGEAERLGSGERLRGRLGGREAGRRGDTWDGGWRLGGLVKLELRVEQRRGGEKMDKGTELVDKVM